MAERLKLALLQMQTSARLSLPGEENKYIQISVHAGRVPTHTPLRTQNDLALLAFVAWL